MAQAQTTPILNGNFSAAFVRTNGTLNGKAPFLPGATGWQMTPSYNAGNPMGFLIMYANIATSAPAPGANIASQWLKALPAGTYTLSFDYRFQNKDPYVTGNGLRVAIGSKIITIPWSANKPWTRVSTTFYLPAGNHPLTFATLLGPKKINLNIAPSPVAWAGIDNVVLVKH